MSDLAARIPEDIKAAMKAKDPVTLNALRALKTAMSNASIEKGHLTSPLDDAEANARAALFLRAQASAFNGVGAIWAPRYRQATFGAFLTDSPAAMQARALAPFATTREAGRGAGLAIVHGLMKRQNGTIAIESRPGEGATVRLVFPAAR